MFIYARRNENDCDVALHCTPKGVRAFYWCRGYKHGTPSGVVQVFHE